MPRGSMTIVLGDEKDVANTKKLLRYIPKRKMHALYQLIAAGNPAKLACKQLGINLKVFKGLLNTIPAFREYIEEAEEVTIAKIEHKVVKQALKGHFPSQHFILSHTTDKYAPPAQKIQQELSGTAQVQHKGLVVHIVGGKIKKRRVVDTEVVQEDLPKLPKEP